MGKPHLAPLVRDLAGGANILRYDGRGNGLSTWDVADISFESWIHDLEIVVDAAGLDKFALFGHSQGGAIAIAYAVRHPERVSHLVYAVPIRAAPITEAKPTPLKFGAPSNPRPTQLGQNQSLLLPGRH